jgi:hypothetical protein
MRVNVAGPTASTCAWTMIRLQETQWGRSIHSKHIVVDTVVDRRYATCKKDERNCESGSHHPAGVDVEPIKCKVSVRDDRVSGDSFDVR